MEFKEEKLNHNSEFAFIATIQVCIRFKEVGMTELQYLDFCKNCWGLLELNDIESLKETLDIKMKLDIEKFGYKKI